MSCGGRAGAGSLAACTARNRARASTRLGNWTGDRARNVAGEWQVLNHAGRCESWDLSSELRIWLSTRSLRIQHIVNDVHNSISNQNIRSKQLCGVDVDVVS